VTHMEIQGGDAGVAETGPGHKGGQEVVAVAVGADQLG
jgi:hypothetical protein